jgi:hypothetical protein
MRQSDGADLPGANNPPNADTGIIYVSSDDARQSILEAILRQDTRPGGFRAVAPGRRANAVLTCAADRQ